MDDDLIKKKKLNLHNLCVILATYSRDLMEKTDSYCYNDIDENDTSLYDMPLYDISTRLRQIQGCIDKTEDVTNELKIDLARKDL